MLTARSVVASTLLGARPPVLPVSVLVRSGALFGIPEGTVRVALSRMVVAGELSADGDGRYRLTGHLLARQQRQEAGRRPRLRRWKGEWLTAMVAGGARPAAERAALRERMRRLRLAEVREGVWLRPDNLAVERDDECLWGTLRPDADAVGLAASLWDLDGWAAQASDFAAELAAWHRSPDLAKGFVLSAAVLRHFNADPLLPPDLLPVSWPGERLRADYEEFDAEFLRLWRSFMG
jgi:phenylacetic acid degradation operon negative regulatory protein